MKRALVDTFFEMVRIDSESGDEGRFIEYLRELFEKKLSARCIVDAYGNLIAHIPASDTTEIAPIMLVAHADTVKPGKGIEPVLRNGVIYSAGETILGADAKAAIVEIFEAVRTSKNRPPVEIIVTRSEEIGCLGAKNLDISQLNARIGFVFDHIALESIIVGGPTHASLDIEILGRAAHAAVPSNGISAISVAARAIDTMPQGQIDQETVTNVGTIQGGTIRNSVPERVSIQAECRSLNHGKCLCQIEEIRRAFQNAAELFGAKVDIKVDLKGCTSRVPEDARTVRIAKDAIASVGLEPKVEVILGGTDALALQEKGVEAVALGYVGKESHTTRENIAVRDMKKEVEIIQHILSLSAAENIGASVGPMDANARRTDPNA